eukprot:2384683-Pyramimonas_sp.AAC.1
MRLEPEPSLSMEENSVVLSLEALLDKFGFRVALAAWPAPVSFRLSLEADATSGRQSMVPSERTRVMVVQNLDLPSDMSLESASARSSCACSSSAVVGASSAFGWAPCPPPAEDGLVPPIPPVTASPRALTPAGVSASTLDLVVLSRALKLAVDLLLLPPQTLSTSMRRPRLNEADLERRWPSLRWWSMLSLVE